MVEPKLTADETLRAIAVLEAVAAGDDSGLIALNAADERPLPSLLAAYGGENLHCILFIAFQTTASMSDAERRARLTRTNACRHAQCSFLLCRALSEQLNHTSSDLAMAINLGRNILDTIGLFTPEDPRIVLRLLRDGAVRRSYSRNRYGESDAR